MFKLIVVDTELIQSEFEHTYYYFVVPVHRSG